MIVRVPAILASTAAAAALTTWALADTAGIVSLQDGLFTEAQAIHGQELYYNFCMACHGDDMSGRDQAPALAGPTFSDVWVGESLWALVERIETMPPNLPGMLSREESVNLLTYMLWFNGLPLGETELNTEKKVLENVAFELPALQ
jgi:mono/diheme cytochrome c family protein